MTMNSLTHIEQSVAALSKELPVEDVWYFEASSALECGLTKPFHLVLFVQEGAEAHKVEAQANEILRRDRDDISAHAFPISAVYQTPRPLVVKMAFSVGQCVCQR
jgi:hypothetical protein